MSKKKEEELKAIKDVSRPAIDAASMTQSKDQTDEEWYGVKAKAKAEGRNVSDAEYETRYQALLKRYNIKPENYETSSGGAATYYEEGKKDSQSEKQGKAPSEQKKAPVEQKKAQSTPTKSKTSTKATTASKSKKTPPPQSTGRAQTSKTGSNISPKKEVKEAPKQESTPSKSERTNYPKPAMEHIADSKTPVYFKYFKERDMSNIKPVSSFIKKNSEEGKERMEERSKRRRADIMKYGPQSASDTTKKKQGKPSTKTVNADIGYERKPLTIQAPQTKNKSQLDTILEKEKKKFKYKQ